MEAKEQIEKLAKEAAEKTQEKEKLAAALVKYPDLKIVKNRWNTEFYSSVSVNSKVNQSYTKYNCGCCADSPKELHLYFIDEELNMRIFSEPYMFFIGQKTYYGSDAYDENWSTRLREKGISEELVSVLEKKYVSNDDDEYDDEDDDIEYP